MYPLLVACKSQSNQRRDAAMSVVEAVRIHSAALVEQAQLVRVQTTLSAVNKARCLSLPVSEPADCT